MPFHSIPDPQIIPFDLRSNIVTTIPATNAKKTSQKPQHMHVRFDFLRCCSSSHDSLLCGSAEMLVQNLKREGGRPERPRVSWLALRRVYKGCLDTDEGANSVVVVVVCVLVILRRGGRLRLGLDGAEEVEDVVEVMLDSGAGADGDAKGCWAVLGLEDDGEKRRVVVFVVDGRGMLSGDASAGEGGSTY
jgi:hypothetical protein